jgi:SAM-dependent methyltransferase
LSAQRTFADSAAVGELERLLVAGEEVRRGDGYLDVLGSNPREGIREEQAVFRSRLLPPIYERIWRPLVSRMFFGRGLPEAEERGMVMEMLRLAPDETVLDVGCGTGNYSRQLAAASGRGLVAGLDASKAMLASAAKRGGGANLAYVRGDACALPFPDGTFDVVCSIGVIHMIGEPMKALAEMVQVLGSGGRLLVVASCDEAAIPMAKGQIRTFGRDELTTALQEAGFTAIEQRVVHRGQFVAGKKPN